MTKFLRGLSFLLFLSALAGIAALFLSDLSHAFRLSSFHQQASATSLILIGASFISLQLSLPLRWSEKFKRIFLGLAFVLWGGEQFLPPGRLVTLMDSAVITIFVVDLGMMILSRLHQEDRQTT